MEFLSFQVSKSHVRENEWSEAGKKLLKKNPRNCFGEDNRLTGYEPWEFVFKTSNCDSIRTSLTGRVYVLGGGWEAAKCRLRSQVNDERCHFADKHTRANVAALHK